MSAVLEHEPSTLEKESVLSSFLGQDYEEYAHAEAFQTPFPQVWRWISQEAKPLALSAVLAAVTLGGAVALPELTQPFAHKIAYQIDDTLHPERMIDRLKVSARMVAAQQTLQK